jgi:phenylacetate-CoA ligase
MLPDGIVKRSSSWRYVGEFFHTGPSAYCNVTNPVEQQIEFLNKFQPTYLMSYPETLEHLAFTAGSSFPGGFIKGLIGISEQMTAEMQRRITRVFNAQVRQTYGLNEIGLVAAMCDAGRYHVHSEHCVVELINEEGQPCQPGETGRIIVTALNNAAMPLIRYDTDDLAEAVSSECPCGRTLPSFGQVFGRYSRIAYLPEGTLWQVGIIREAIEANPDALAKNLRQYQIYQYEDRGFEIRLACSAPLPGQFLQNIQRKWVESGNGDIKLAFSLVDKIPRGPGGKHQEFDSEYYPHNRGGQDSK